MMEQLWSDILVRFGQGVTLRDKEDERSVQALIQPCLERSLDQQTSSPLGLKRQDRFLYMGPAGHPLSLDTLVEWQGKEYRVQSSHLVGDKVCPYWWAMLFPRDEVSL